MIDDTSINDLAEMLGIQWCIDKLGYRYINNQPKRWEEWPSAGYLQSEDGTRWEWRKNLIDIGGLG